MKISTGICSIRNKFVYLSDQFNKYAIPKAVFFVFYEFFQKRSYKIKGITFPDFSKNLESTIAAAVHADAHENKESSFFSIQRAFLNIPIPYQNIKLLDIGCGSGKSMVLGMKYEFKSVLGVDLDVSSLEQGTKNCERMKALGYETTFDFINKDATLLSIPEGINVLYLFNPFGLKTIIKVVKNIVSFVQKENATIYIIYMNPVYIDCFLESGFFTIHYTSYFKNRKKREMVILKSTLQ